MVEKLRLSKRVLDSLELPEGKNRMRFYDKDVSGFGVTLFASGRKSFFVQYGPSTRRRRMKLGDYGALSPDNARAKAQEVLGQIATGGDPLDDRQRSRGIPTFKDWVNTYMVEVERRKKETSKDRRFLAMASERWGTKRLDEITVEDVRKMFEHLSTSGGERGKKKGKPVKIRANRWLASVRACLQAAWREDKLPSNPAMRVRPNPENPPRNRVLDDKEFKRLCEAVDQIDDPHVRAAFVLLVATGARLSEVLRSKWADVDLDAGLWHLPHTKAGKSQVVPLGPVTVATLTDLERKGPFLIPGREPLKPRTELREPWEALKEAADLNDVRIHDIRRTFGLHIAKNSGLHLASKLLRHTDIRVTERVYAPLGISDQREATEAREAEILAFQPRQETQNRR